MRMMLAGLLLPWFVLLPAVPVAQAASFDCGKASTPVEKAICANPELSRRDEVLAKAYATALGGLSDEAKATMQAGQRAWLKYAELSCTDHATPFTAALNEDQQRCLVNNYSQRIRELGESRMQGDWRIYLKTTYDVVDDPDPDVFQEVSANEMVSPRIDDSSEAVAAFNALMDEADAAQAPDPSDEGYASSDTMIETKVVSAGTDRISLQLNSWWFGHGAAHGNYTITYSHYLIDKQRMLEASDLFTGDGWQEALGQMALDELDRTIDGGIWDEARPEVPKVVIDPSRWNITGDALEIIFQPYEVTAYAAGAPTISIPWGKLSAYLADGYTSLLY
jgi:uncharacterized protein